MHTRLDLPWLIMGEFEQFSASDRPERQMCLFREVLTDCYLVDLGSMGLPYTYNNGREGVTCESPP